MSCGKKSYSSHKEASFKIRDIKSKSHRSHIPKRAYYCKICKAWHLTSLSLKKGESFKEDY